MTVPYELAGLHCAASDPRFSEGDDPGVDTVAPALLARTVLIIEDEVMIAWMLESLLEDMGFKDIRIASSGRDAVMLGQSCAPGLILSDINLDSSDLDGVDASSAIAAQGDVFVLFITGYADARARERITRTIPRAALLRKPVDPADLRQAIVGFSRADRLQ